MRRVGVLTFGRASRRPRSGEERVDLRCEEDLIAGLRLEGLSVLPAGAPFHEEDAIAFDRGDVERLVATFHLRPVDVLLVDAGGDGAGELIEALAQVLAAADGIRPGIVVRGPKALAVALDRSLVDLKVAVRGADAALDAPALAQILG